MTECGDDSYTPTFDHSYAKWDELQMEQYVDWVNALLRDRGHELRVSVDSFGEDLSDGVILLHLIEVLSGKALPNRANWSRRKQQRFQKLDNVQSAIAYMERLLSIRVIGCHPADIVGANTKQTLGLIFLLSQKTQSGLPVLPSSRMATPSFRLPSPRSTSSTTATPSTQSTTSPRTSAQSTSPRTTTQSPRSTPSATSHPVVQSSAKPAPSRAGQMQVGGSFHLSSSVQAVVSKAAAGALRGTEVHVLQSTAATSGDVEATLGGGNGSPLHQSAPKEMKNLQLLRVKGMSDMAKELSTVVLLQTAVRAWLARSGYREARARFAERIATVERALRGNAAAMRGLLRLQAYARYLCHESAAVRQRAHARRIAQEIVATEETYIVCLKNLKKKFLAPLLEPPLVGQIPAHYHQPLRAAIGNLQPIVRTSKQLLSTLKSRQSKLGAWYWGQDLGSVFFDFAAFLKQYQFFINDYTANLHMLRWLDTNCPDVNKYFAAKSRESNRLDFASLLIQPIQRIPRYLMLLSDLLKRTGAEHPHYAKLLEARDKLSNIADHINQGKAAAENRATLVQIAQKCDNLDAPLVDPSRRYVREGVLTLCKAGASGEHIDSAYVFLFSDMLLVTKTTRAWRQSHTAGRKSATITDKPLFRVKRTVNLAGADCSWYLRDPDRATSLLSSVAPPSPSPSPSLSPSSSSPMQSRRFGSGVDASSSSPASAAASNAASFALAPMNVTASGSGGELLFAAPDGGEKASWMSALDDVLRELGEQKKSRNAVHPYPVPPAETSFDEAVEYAGTVWRRSSKSGEWSERRMLLKNDALYTSLPGDATPALFTAVICCSVRVSAVMDRPNAFEILISKPLKKNVILSCASNAERFDWIRCIRTCSEKIIELHLRTVDRQAAAQAVRTAAARLRGKLDPAIEAVLDLPGNDVCADCSSPDVEWVCLSRGVFLCATCGSIHRRLSGQQIVSLTRGRWSPDKIRQLQGLPGNLLANELYEKHLDSDQRKPVAASSNADKTAYIQAKYTRAADARVEQVLHTRRELSFSGDLSFPAAHVESPSHGRAAAVSQPPGDDQPLQYTGSPQPQIGSHSMRGNRRAAGQEGWLFKQTKRRGYKNVYAVLRRKKLCLFADDQRKKSAGNINLYLATVQREPAEPGVYIFKITCPTREYLFSVKSPSELESWLASLNKQINTLKSSSVKSLKRKKGAIEEVASALADVQLQ